MASKRALGLIPMPYLPRLPSSAPARALRAIRQPAHFPPISSSSARLAHSIPRPRSRSPFTQQQQPAAAAAAAAAASASTPNASQPHPSSTSSSSSTSTPPPLTPNKTTPSRNSDTPNVRQQPHYELTFTCRPCGHRSRHRVSKQGYHHGSVLIACPGCRARHVISDHLRIFGDAARTVEDILRERGEAVKRGTLRTLRTPASGGGAAGSDGVDGPGEGYEEDVEFWEDGTTTVREPWPEPEPEPEVSGERAAGKESNNGAGGDDAPPGSTFKRA